MPMSIMDLLAIKVNETDDTDPDWRNMVRDYKTQIIDNSVQYQVSLSLMDAVAYNSAKFLRYISAKSSLRWIMLYINDIHTDINFINLTTIYVPNSGYIDDLYTTYQTITSVA